VGKPGASSEALEAACRAANAHEFVSLLPQGYDTVIGERGIRLSGGQRQRIAIARAILRDAPILVLDEALSAVDAANESIIQEALDRLMRGRTTLIFAHRLSSIIDADRILVLDGGAIAEEGTHTDLMSQNGVYHRLMSAQASERSTGAIDLDASLKPKRVEASTFSEAAEFVPTDAIVKAEGLGWTAAALELLKYIKPYKGRLAMTFGFGVTRVIAYIGIGVVSALAVRAC
jgi:ATP-binding cassette subfamily C protein CydCD